MNRADCSATTRAGQRCRAFALSGEPWCKTHHPDYVEERRAICAKGARLKAINGRRPRLDDAAGLLRFNADLVHRLLAGELETDVVRVVVNALNLQRQLIEAGDIERRLAELEARLRARQPATSRWTS
jgi:hypothetical protein